MQIPFGAYCLFIGVCGTAFITSYDKAEYILFIVSVKAW